MIVVRRSDERGFFDHGWLQTRHTFSFGDYVDPRHMGFGNLRVINEDHVAAGQGFGTHPHRDMEIVTWVVSGAVQHEDSMGNGGVVRPGEVQRMSAGTGLTHSELNPSPTEDLHLLQIWILPETKGLEPSYEQRTLELERLEDRLCLAASRDGREGSVTIHQDADMYVARLGQGTTLTHPLGAGRSAWVQVVTGQVDLGNEHLGPGDGAAITEAEELLISATATAEFLLFDLA